MTGFPEQEPSYRDRELRNGLEGLEGDDVVPQAGVKQWKDTKNMPKKKAQMAAGWIAYCPVSSRSRWFNKNIWGSWRLAFQLALLQREVWQSKASPAQLEAGPGPPAADKKTPRVRLRLCSKRPAQQNPTGRGRPLGSRPRGRPPKASGKVEASARGRGRGRARGRGRPRGSGRGGAGGDTEPNPEPAKRPAPSTAEPKAEGSSRAAPKRKFQAPALAAPVAVPRTPANGLLGGRHRALSLFNLGTEAGREALVGFMKNGYTVVRDVFSEAECDAAVDKIWDFAEGRCPGLKSSDEATWTAENWLAFARGKNLCQLLGAGWVLWKERLLFRNHLVERGVYADRPHHVSWDGFSFGRPTHKFHGRPTEWDHTDQVLMGGESTGCTWIQGVVALNSLNPEVGAAFECWPGTQEEDVFLELQKTPGLCETPNGTFRPLLEAGRGWLQGKGFRRQRVPVRRGDVILWDSRLVHQGGAPLTVAGSRAREPSGGRRTFIGRAAAYFCLGPREFTPEAVLKKRREAFQAGGAALTLNHKPDGFEPFKKSRFHAGSTGMAYPTDLTEEAKALHGLL